MNKQVYVWEYKYTLLSYDKYLNVMISLKINLFFSFKTSVPPKNAQFYNPLILSMGTAMEQWLRYCATNRKVAGLIPDGVTGIFH
jgi:hypothetical protein